MAFLKPIHPLQRYPEESWPVQFSDIGEGSEDDDSSRDENRLRALFNPPMGKQRISEVLSIISSFRGGPLTVVDLGCGKCELLCKMACVSYVEEAIGVDIDEEILVTGRSNLHSHSGEKLSRDQPYRALLYQGDITQLDDRVLMADVVTCIEVIEHLNHDQIASLVQVVFGHIKPCMAIFSTPNAELNASLGLAAGQLRHDDHKFEWTRKEFNDWCASVIADHPTYSYEIRGCGSLSDMDTERYGHCTQFSVFTAASENQPKFLRSDHSSDTCVDQHSYVPFYEVEFWNRLSKRMKLALVSAFNQMADELIQKYGGPRVDEIYGDGCWVPVKEFLKDKSLMPFRFTKNTLCLAMVDLGWPVNLRTEEVFVPAF